MKVKVTGEILYFLPLHKAGFFSVLELPSTGAQMSFVSSQCVQTPSRALVPGQILSIIRTDTLHWNAEEIDWPGVRAWGQEVRDEKKMSRASAETLIIDAVRMCYSPLVSKHLDRISTHLGRTGYLWTTEYCRLNDWFSDNWPVDRLKQNKKG